MCSLFFNLRRVRGRWRPSAHLLCHSPGAQPASAHSEAVHGECRLASAHCVFHDTSGANQMLSHGLLLPLLPTLTLCLPLLSTCCPSTFPLMSAVLHDKVSAAGAIT